MIEVVVGIGLAGMVLTGIYTIAAGAIRLGNGITEHQQAEMHLHSFLGVMRRNIEGLPGNANISMEPPEGIQSGSGSVGGSGGRGGVVRPPGSGGGAPVQPQIPGGGGR